MKNQQPKPMAHNASKVNSKGSFTMFKNNSHLNYKFNVIIRPNGICVRVALPERMRHDFLQGLSKRVIGLSTGDLYSELFTKPTMTFFFTCKAVYDLVPHGIAPQVWFYDLFLDALYNSMIDVYFGGLAY